LLDAHPLSVSRYPLCWAIPFAVCLIVEGDENIFAVICARNYFIAYRSTPNAADSSYTVFLQFCLIPTKLSDQEVIRWIDPMYYYSWDIMALS
jgi:hypothetical protein